VIVTKSGFISVIVIIVGKNACIAVKYFKPRVGSEPVNAGFNLYDVPENILVEKMPEV
jgi:hypothetical protein